MPLPTWFNGFNMLALTCYKEWYLQKKYSAYIYTRMRLNVYNCFISKMAERSVKKNKNNVSEHFKNPKIDIYGFFNEPN